MRWVLLAGVVLVASLAAALPATGAGSGDRYYQCGDLRDTDGGIQNVRSKNVPCRTAKKVARRFYYHPDSKPLGFNCRQVGGGNAGPIRCTRGDGNKVVRFLFVGAF